MYLFGSNIYCLDNLRRWFYLSLSNSMALELLKLEDLNLMVLVSLKIEFGDNLLKLILLLLQLLIGLIINCSKKLTISLILSSLDQLRCSLISMNLYCFYPCSFNIHFSRSLIKLDILLLLLLEIKMILQLRFLISNWPMCAIFSILLGSLIVQMLIKEDQFCLFVKIHLLSLELLLIHLTTIILMNLLEFATGISLTSDI